MTSVGLAPGIEVACFAVWFIVARLTRLLLGCRKGSPADFNCIEAVSPGTRGGGIAGGWVDGGKC